MGCTSHKHLSTKTSLNTDTFNIKKSHLTRGGFNYKGDFMDKKQANKVNEIRSHRYGECRKVANAVRDRVYIKCSCGAFTIIELNDGKK